MVEREYPYGVKRWLMGKGGGGRVGYLSKTLEYALVWDAAWRVQGYVVTYSRVKGAGEPPVDCSARPMYEI